MQREYIQKCASTGIVATKPEGTASTLGKLEEGSEGDLLKAFQYLRGAHKQQG